MMIGKMNNTAVMGEDITSRRDTDEPIITAIDQCVPGTCLDMFYMKKIKHISCIKMILQELWLLILVGHTLYLYGDI